MTIPLDKVKELNYDHHRRMTEQARKLMETGSNDQGGFDQKGVDELSYESLLRVVPRDMHSILELGSASGGQWHTLQEWLVEGGTISGIDLYEPFVVESKKRGLDITLGFVEDMPFPDESFDLVCSRHVLEHLGDVDDGIKQIKRVLKKGGYSAHVTPLLAFDNEPAHINKWSLEQWVAKWQEHGFLVVSFRMEPYNGNEAHVVCRKVQE